MTSPIPAATASGVVTSFLPLTTVYTPSADCYSKFRLNGPSLVAFDPGYGLDIDPDVDCEPRVVTTWWEQGLLGGGGDAHTAVSIGPLICPDEWTTVASSVKDKTSTVAMCCPSGYTLQNGIKGSIIGDCKSEVSSGMTLTYASTSIRDHEDWSIVTTTLSDSSAVGAIAVLGWNVEAATTSPATKTGQSTTTPLTKTSTTAPPARTTSSDSSPGGNSGGISTGAAAGIGVGVGVGVIGLAALLLTLWILRRRKNKNAAAAAIAAEHHGPSHHPSMVYYQSPGAGPTPGQQHQHHELGTQGGPKELHSDSSPAELYG